MNFYTALEKFQNLAFLFLTGKLQWIFIEDYV